MAGTPPAIYPQQTMLLVMDYQPATLRSLAETRYLLSRVADAIAVVRQAGGRVGYVRMAFEDADYDALPPHTLLATRVTSAGRAFHSQSPTAAILAELAPEPGDLVVRKTRVGAFSTTELDRQLRDDGLSTLVLAGVSTSGVVLSTVRDAADRDYQIFVLADASADPDPAAHEFLTRVIFPRQAYVITTDELRDLLAAGAAIESADLD
jgi:nicotinamidase-related amidase